MKGKYILAHRASWAEREGAIPSGLKVLHKCDTPACINPDHLYLGTDADNARDRDARGRHNPPIGERNVNAVLAVEDIRLIRESTLSNAALGRHYGVNRSAIRAVRSRATWRHIS